MAIYHCNIKIGSKSKGQSAIAASAYRSATKLYDQSTGITSNFLKKTGVVYSEIDLCKNAPSEYANRENLWNAVHKVEKAKNAQLWREIEVALPKEFDRQEQIDTVRKFVKRLTDEGMCADWSIHDKDGSNPHAHIMLTMRSIKPDGTWAPKCRKVYDLDKNGNKIFQKIDKLGRKQYKCRRESYNDWDKKEKVEEWRAFWAECCNRRLDNEHKIDHRSYKRQGIDKIPMIHEGYVARKMKSHGEDSDRVAINEEIRKSNDEIEEIERQIAELEREKKKILKEIDKENRIEQEEYDRKEKYIESFGLHNWRIIKEMKEVSRALNILSDRKVKNGEDLEQRIIKAKQMQNDLNSEITSLNGKEEDLHKCIELREQFGANRSFYIEMKNKRTSIGRNLYEKSHEQGLKVYRKALKQLREYYPEGKFPSTQEMTVQLEECQSKIKEDKAKLKDINTELDELIYSLKMICKISKIEMPRYDDDYLEKSKDKGRYFSRSDFRKKYVPKDREQVERQQNEKKKKQHDKDMER